MLYVASAKNIVISEI